jgi:phage-related tail protein
MTSGHSEPTDLTASLPTRADQLVEEARRSAQLADQARQRTGETQEALARLHDAVADTHETLADAYVTRAHRPGIDDADRAALLTEAQEGRDQAAMDRHSANTARKEAAQDRHPHDPTPENG